MKIFRVFLIIICAAIVMVTVEGCAVDTAVIDNSGATADTTAAEQTTTMPAPDLPEGINYNGYKFTILITGNTENWW